MKNQKEHIILFDGVCNLCNSSVQYVIDRDKKDIFSFASLQSEFANEMKKKHELETTKLDSIVYIQGNNVFVKSSAALEIAKNLGGLTSLLYIFKPIPRFIRDKVYDWIARNRYKWFGQQDHCMIPTPELKSKFLD